MEGKKATAGNLDWVQEMVPAFGSSEWRGNLVKWPFREFRLSEKSIQVFCYPRLLGSFYSQRKG
jgi:hypothetical protein